MRIFIIALLLVWGGEALAAEDVNSANYQLPGCQGFVESTKTIAFLRQGYCAGLVRGIGDMQVAVREACIPPKVTIQQAIRVVIQYTAARPAQMHKSFNSFVRQALMTAWPCKK